MKNYLGSSFNPLIPLRKRTGKDFTENCLVNTAIFITLAAFLFMVTGCSYYRSTTRVNEGSVNLLTETINKLYPEEEFPRERYPVSNLKKMLFMDYQVYLVDPDGTWQLTEAETVDDTVKVEAILSPVPADSMMNIPEDRVSVKYKPKEESDLLKRIFIYTDKVEFDQSGRVSLAENDISRIIQFKDYAGPKAGLVLLIFGGALTITMVALTIIAMSHFSIEY